MDGDLPEPNGGLRQLEHGEPLQSRFEYAVRGPDDLVCEWLHGLGNASYLVERRSVNGAAYALLLSREPLRVPATLSGVTFDELRQGDRDGTLSWLWQRIDRTAYTR